MSWSIQVDGLAKMYRVGRGPSQKFDSFYEVVTDAFLGAAEKVTKGRSRRILPARIPARPLEIQSEHMVLSEAQFEGAPPGHFWALRDISFRVEAGQRIGIIGRNGSGKSTLLKILSRITSPTQGEFKFRGRLISLLEIGTGFHPDLSGRENVYLNAKINGLTDRQIRAVFDEIVEFSELGVQIDTPIKRYSSGMYMRLAFSVAAHLNSEILVVDEVLAVGDAGFQKKCLTKMLDIGNSGRTLLFVSHDMDAVRKLCSSALELSHGRIVSHESTASSAAPDAAAGEITVGSGLQSVSTAITEYSLAGHAAIRAERAWSDDKAPRVPSGRIVVKEMSVRDARGEVHGSFAAEEEIRLRLDMTGVAGGEWDVRVDLAGPSGHTLASTLHRLRFALESADASLRVAACAIPARSLNPGLFRVSVVVSDPGRPEEFVSIPDALGFLVEEPRGSRADSRLPPEGPLALASRWISQ